MSLGNDLASIRKKNGLTLEEIQSSIKIPLYTLTSIEDDTIFDSTEHNATYIRSFIRSYARALKINDADIVNALDEVEGGIYNGGLIPSTETRVANEIEESKKNAEKAQVPFSLSDVSPPNIEVAPITEKPSVESVNWADVGKKFAHEESSSKTLVIGGIIFFVVLLFALLFFFRNEVINVFSSTDAEVIEEPVESITEDPLSFIPETPSTAEDIDDTESSTEISPTTIQPLDNSTSINNVGDTISVSVYAAFDLLDPVRVTSDLSWKTNPFWIEQGQAYNFDFNDTLLVRGQYSRMLLLYNGHVIENARQQYFNSEFNSILITKSIFDNPKYSSPAPEVFPYDIGAPDSVINVLGSN